MNTLSLFSAPPPAATEPTEDIDLDDYDDAALADVVDPPRLVPRVLVMPADVGFWVSRVRDDGTTVACVHYSREELAELVTRCRAALT